MRASASQIARIGLHCTIWKIPLDADASGMSSKAMYVVQITYRLSTAILKMVKPINHFKAMTQKIQMVSETKYHYAV